MKLLSLVAILWSGVVSASDFQAIPISEFSWQRAATQTLVFRNEDHFITASSTINFKDQHYYFIQTPNDAELKSWLKAHSQVVFNEQPNFQVVRINKEADLLEVSHRLHEAGGACGMIQKISGSPLPRSVEIAPLVYQGKSPEVAEAINSVKVENILNKMDEMVSWSTRFHNSPVGLDTGEKLQELYLQHLPGHRTDVEIELVEHRGSPQKSLIVRIPGTLRPNEVVILGSHLDSINQSSESFAPGADDDASGTSTNLEIFRVLMARDLYPESTIEIHAYAAEEIGLIGSGEIAESYRKQQKQVLAMVQFDLTGFTASKAKITFVTNSTDSSLTGQLSRMAQDYLKVPVSSGYLLFGSSDHASWNRQGFPVAFPTEDPFAFNRAIHTSNDTMAKINSPEQVEAFGRLGLAYLMHFGRGR